MGSSRLALPTQLRSYPPPCPCGTKWSVRMLENCFSDLWSLISETQGSDSKILEGRPLQLIAGRCRRRPRLNWPNPLPFFNWSVMISAGFWYLFAAACWVLLDYVGFLLNFNDAITWFQLISATFNGFLLIAVDFSMIYGDSVKFCWILLSSFDSISADLSWFLLVFGSFLLLLVAFCWILLALCWLLLIPTFGFNGFLLVSINLCWLKLLFQWLLLIYVESCWALLVRFLLICHDFCWFLFFFCCCLLVSVEFCWVSIDF